jgi:hypothetical protein
MYATSAEFMTSLVDCLSTQWILVPQDTNTFTIQSVIFPGMFISYAGIGISATTPTHSQLVLRGTANAAVFGVQTLSGGLAVK